MIFSAFRVPDASPSLPRNIQLRRAKDEDEAATFDVMRRAMGYEMNWQHHAPTRRHLRSAPDSSFWLAEEVARFSRPRVVGYAHSMVRERVWSLTEFFVLPTHHRQGVGRALLERCLEDSTRAQADTRLVLASHHPSANALYIRRAGCFPHVPMLLLSGPAANLRAPADRPAILETQSNETIQSGAHKLCDTSLPLGSVGSGKLIAAPFVLTPDVQQRLDELDRAVVGYARPSEHRLWTEIMGGEMGASRLFRAADTGKIEGYAYSGPHCSGPALAATPQLLPVLLAHVTQLAAAHARSTQEHDFFEPMEPYWAVAGTNEHALRWLLDCGWQIVFQYQLMCTRPLGQLDRYACHNPLYML